MVCRWCWCGILGLAALSAAAEPAVKQDAAGGVPQAQTAGWGRGAGWMAPRVQAEMTPEEKARFEAGRKRRFEIMVLIESYKIMPEADRAALKRELLKRIEADLRVALEEKKRKLAAAERDLEKLRSDILRREQNASAVAEQEMERLLRAPAPWQRGRGRAAGQPGAGKSPGHNQRPEGERTAPRP